MKKLMTLSLVAVLLSSTAVFAQDQTAFDRLDGDGDDRLEFSDMTAGFPDLTQAQFDTADINSDDFLDITEFLSLSGNGVAAGSTVAAQGTAVEGTVAGEGTEVAGTVGQGDASRTVTIQGMELSQAEINVVTNHCEHLEASEESDDNDNDSSNDATATATSNDNSTSSDSEDSSNTIMGETGSSNTLGIDLDTVNLAVCQESGILD